MKKLLRSIFNNLVSLSFSAYIFPGLTYNSNLEALILASCIFTLINHYFKPIIKLFLLPINLLTLGMLRWVSGVICLFLLTIIIPKIQIQAFDFHGFSFDGFILPPFFFTPFLSLIAASLFISLISSFISWLFNGK